MRRPPCLPCQVRLPAAAGAGPALLLEAIRAVHRLVAARHERHLGLFPARRAGRDVHLARAAAAVAAPATVAVSLAIAAAPATGRLAGLAARRAARGLVGETLLRVELLLARREHKIHPTIPTRDRFVCVAHRSPTPLVKKI